jgi:hypothetical protein
MGMARTKGKSGKGLLALLLASALAIPVTSPVPESVTGALGLSEALAGLGAAEAATRRREVRTVRRSAPVAATRRVCTVVKVRGRNVRRLSLIHI